MSIFDQNRSNIRQFMMGNQAIVRGAIESGVQFAAGYPGTPSSEIVENMAEAAKSLNIYAEWSTNEKVGTEAAAAAAIAGMRSLAAMKNAGLSVALDFLTHLSYTGLGDRGGAMVNIVCDDPDAHSSGDETDSRWLAKFSSAPLLEPATIQEAKDMVQWAFSLSEEFKTVVFFRGYTRLSHASGMVQMGSVPEFNRKPLLDTSALLTPYLGRVKHAALIEKLQKIKTRFETAPFNTYEGPQRPDLVILCSGSGYYCSKEAAEILALTDRVGILKLGALWPFPAGMVRDHLKRTSKILVVEEVDPFVEQHAKAALAHTSDSGLAVYGKESGHIPLFGEITPDRVLSALESLFDVSIRPRPAAYEAQVASAAKDLVIPRGLTWCAGCPHRASFWALEKAIKKDGRNVYVTGDIGCYTLDIFPGGKGRMKLLHAMGSGTGLASGIGQLTRFGFDQPVVSICGDSTFFHGSIPGLINAVYNRSNMVQIILDNSATAMTGFQPHPGTKSTAMGGASQQIDIVGLCRSIGADVAVSDPFDIRGTTKTMRALLKQADGVRVLVLRRQCEILRMKTENAKTFRMALDADRCRGKSCGICSREFRCPALVVDAETDKSVIREDICSGCGVCTETCPFNAISKEE